MQRHAHALTSTSRGACPLAADILLLDEPTNHLDVPAVVWLENYLLDYDATLVVVSHDRRFLNAVSTDVIHLHNKKLEYYKGDYDTFETVRAERRKQQERATESNDMRRAHIQVRNANIVLVLPTPSTVPSAKLPQSVYYLL